MAWTQKRRTPSDYLNPHKAARILAAHGYVCHLCGHGQAEQIDHIICWAEWTIPDVSVHDAGNLAPAHGEPCPTCGRQCHKDKSKAEAARGSTRRAQRGKRVAEQHPGWI